jgi:dienelactone hydrolase
VTVGGECPGAALEFGTFSAPGFFGDREVLIHRALVDRPKAPLVALLHGVHGCASPERGNKYGDLARLLAAEGYESMILESSRLRRDREIFGDDREAWIRLAFTGKTFEEELADSVSGLRRIVGRRPGRPLVLLGFSLGGILSVLIAGGAAEGLLSASRWEVSLWARELPPLFCLSVAGSGDALRPEAAGQLRLPVLDRLPDPEILREAATRLSAPRALTFYGGEDKTFSEESCRGLFDRYPLAEERKRFLTLSGADHAFREQRGLPSVEPIREIVRELVAFLEGCPE